MNDGSYGKIIGFRAVASCRRRQLSAIFLENSSLFSSLHLLLWLIFAAQSKKGRAATNPTPYCNFVVKIYCISTCVYPLM